MSRVEAFLRWLVQLRGSPEAIAGGLAIGTFVAFTPTVGAQLVIAPFLATVLGANRPAALLPVWITNPLTLVPVYGFTYRVGCLFWPGPPTAEVIRNLRELSPRLARLEFWDMGEQLRSFAASSVDIIAPLTIGGVVVGSVLGVAVYYPALFALRRLRRRREARREHHGSKRRS